MIVGPHFSGLGPEPDPEPTPDSTPVLDSLGVGMSDQDEFDVEIDRKPYNQFGDKGHLLAAGLMSLMSQVSHYKTLTDDPCSDIQTVLERYEALVDAMINFRDLTLRNWDQDRDVANSRQSVLASTKDGFMKVSINTFYWATMAICADGPQEPADIQKRFLEIKAVIERCTAKFNGEI
jgi:hypothetical protein